jgi:hypothetical protein
MTRSFMRKHFKSLSENRQGERDSPWRFSDRHESGRSVPDRVVMMTIDDNRPDRPGRARPQSFGIGATFKHSSPPRLEHGNTGS